MPTFDDDRELTDWDDESEAEPDMVTQAELAEYVQLGQIREAIEPTFSEILSVRKRLGRRRPR